ncbi:hypothetical protein E2C01_022406 [Portunus trituberculatus]|uniref:Uncharacterized protein n=1 Tax=Portunus trituberculatus TaxID=210409 RepID=A0A5B7E774_PORTR|nr:hypothetical protein [Portunus trituberculatus]
MHYLKQQQQQQQQQQLLLLLLMHEYKVVSPAAVSRFCSIWSSTSMLCRSFRYLINLSRSPMERGRISSKSRSKLRISRGTTSRIFR